MKNASPHLNSDAARANRAAYDTGRVTNMLDGAPHLKHAALQRMYRGLAQRIYSDAVKHTPVPRVLDLGAGEGSSSMPFLELGAHVTAIEVSTRKVELFQTRGAQFQDRLEIRTLEIDTVLAARETYDIVLAISTLHHIPDYLAMTHSAVGLLAPHGQFFSFQDPLNYDSIDTFNRTFSDIAYTSWRVFRPDAMNGFRRRLRRRRGIYDSTEIADMGEYHVVRKGVDQEAVVRQLANDGLQCEMIQYFSTQSTVFQAIGANLGAKNTFAVVARKTS